MLAPRDPQPVADLPDRGVGSHRGQDRGHQVALSPRGRLEAVHRAGPGLGRAFGTDPADALDLAALPVRVDPMKGRRRDLVVAEAVDPDDDLVARLDRP